MHELYFRDKGNREHFVREFPSTPDSKSIYQAFLNDFKTRRPDFVSYYWRSWTDDNNDMWIDYGSHSEFYILRRKGE